MSQPPAKNPPVKSEMLKKIPENVEKRRCESENLNTSQIMKKFFKSSKKTSKSWLQPCLIIKNAGFKML
jgi:hypothetical protein